jgi:predicted RND superfamily exporter protein
MRWPILLLSVIFIGFLTSGARHLTFRGDYRVFFGEDNPQLLDFDALQNIYSKNDSLMYVLVPKNGEVFTKENLAAVGWLTDRCWEELPFSTRVDSITNFPYTEGTEDDLIVRDLVEEAESMDEAALAKAKKFALDEPLIVNRIISPDATITAVNTTFNLPGEKITELDELYVVVRDIEKRFLKEYPNFEVYITGVIPLNQAFGESAKSDMMTLVPLMYLLLLTTMVLMLRSFTGTALTVFVIGMSAAGAMGFAGHIGIVITPQSVIAPTMILTMAIADSIHILVPMLTWMRQGQSKEEALVESLRINLLPVFITSVTTAIGFLSMNFSDTPPLHDLGNITAAGVFLAFLLSVGFLPALAAILPMRVKVRESHKGTGMERLGDWVVRNHIKLLFSTGIFMAVIASFAVQNDLNDEFVKYFDESIRFRRDADFTAEHLTGIYSVDYSIESGETNGVADPEYLATLDKFAIWFREQPDVVHVNTLSDTFKRLNMNMHADDPSMYILPDNRELSAQYLLLYEMSLPYGRDLNNQINVDKSATRVTVTMSNISSKRLREIARQGQEWLEVNVPEMASPAVGPALMFAFISERNINGMLGGTTLALIGISFILMFALRSVKYGVLSLIPNLLPAAVSFGIWGLFVGQVGMALSVVTAMTLGIVVDDTVHFLTKYLQARRERELSAEDAVRYAFKSVGGALVATSAILAAGFLVLSFSGFAQNADMGKMSAITILVALFADFFFLPPLLIVLDKLQGARHAD